MPWDDRTRFAAACFDAELRDEMIVELRCRAAQLQSVSDQMGAAMEAITGDFDEASWLADTGLVSP